MSDGKNLFHADHGNVSDGGGVPSETTLSDARLAMRRQVGLQGNLIEVQPAFVLVAALMETATEKLLTSIQAVTTDGVNPFSRLSLVVEPRFADGDRWYVVADPNQIDGLEFAYLAGSPGPQTETQAGFHVDAVEVKVRLGYGCGFVESRGWYSNSGGTVSGG